MRTSIFVAATTLLVLAAPCGCRPLENYTDAEMAALADRTRSGRARIAVKDGATGRPIASCRYYAFQYSTEEAAVDRRPPIMVDGPVGPPAPDGIHEFPLPPGWYRLRLESEGYAAAWTPEFEVLDGRTTPLATEMEKGR